MIKNTGDYWIGEDLTGISMAFCMQKVKGKYDQNKTYNRATISASHLLKEDMFSVHDLSHLQFFQQSLSRVCWYFLSVRSALPMRLQHEVRPRHERDIGNRPR